MSFRPEHELHKRRRGRNIGVGLMLGAFVVLIMALTSTRRWMRRLGRWWKRLHTMVYGVLGLAAVHYLLMIRSDWAWPVAYAVCAVTLLVMRLIHHRQVTITGR